MSRSAAGTEFTKSMVSISGRESQLVRKSKRARVFLLVTCATLIIFLISFLIVTPKNISNFYNVCACTFFGVAGALLVIMLIVLVITINRNFKSDLKKETKQLRMSQTTFVATFLIRVVLIILVVKGDWADFTRDFK